MRAGEFGWAAVEGYCDRVSERRYLIPFGASDSRAVRHAGIGM